MPTLPKSSDERKTTVSAWVTREEAKALRALADQRQMSMTRLVRHALELTYPTTVPPNAQ